MIKQTTFARYRTALEQIASGAPESVSIAQEALRSRKPPPSDKPKFRPNERRELRREKVRARDEQIYLCSVWGEPAKVLADRHKISVSRIQGVVAEQKFRGQMAYPRCITCGHSGSMHHDDCLYNRGPCAEYLCECSAMDGGCD